MASTIHAVVKTQKKVLRKEMSKKLLELSRASIDEQSYSITKRILSLPAFQKCSIISCYLSMPSGEAVTDEIVDAILHMDKKLYVPKIVKTSGTMDLVRVYSSDDLSSFPRGSWGIREPGDSWEGRSRDKILGSPSEKLDMILVPGVAFDRGLSRLGHGKGYYDRFITSYTSSNRPKPLLVGIALHEQLLEENQVVPTVDHDWQLDVLVTPQETIMREDSG